MCNYSFLAGMLCHFQESTTRAPQLCQKHTADGWKGQEGTAAPPRVISFSQQVLELCLHLTEGETEAQRD